MSFSLLLLGAGCDRIIGWTETHVPAEDEVTICGRGGCPNDGVCWGGQGGLCVPKKCKPLCVRNDYVFCDRGLPEGRHCQQGCVADPQAHCEGFHASNDADHGDLAEVTGELVVPSGRSYSINTDSGEIVDFTYPDHHVLVRPPTLVDPLDEETQTSFRLASDRIGVLAVGALTVENNARLTGIGQRALIILSRGRVLMNGWIDFPAGCARDGRWDYLCGDTGGGEGGLGSVPARGCAPGGRIEAGANMERPGSGGGGGGLGSRGASGGQTVANPSLDDVAETNQCPGPALEPLVGGSGGGAGGGEGGGRGGGGGGAIQITSFDHILVDGTIDVSGAGGAGGQGGGGGGGGGSGGSILLEAPFVQLGRASTLAANGGGGGGITPMANGARGTASTKSAAGGGTGSPGAGGMGGSLSSDPTAGSVSPAGGGGGGGGGVGLIRINARSRVPDSGAEVSPPYSFGQITME